MKRSTVGAMALMAVTVVISLSGRARPDSPQAAPTKKTIWSANKRFFAVTDPGKQVTTVYEAAPGKKEEKLWSMYGWFPSAVLVDDGERLIVDYWGELIRLGYDKGQVMVYFFKRGELINQITLDQIIRDNSKLRRTTSHYYWGSCKGLDRAARFVLETVEGRTFRYDIATGTQVTEEVTSSQSESAKDRGRGTP